jgi:biopolymer transport protein ExbD
MAEKKRLLDVWIVEINTVYRQVPFAVVTDWLQEGRLLPEDKVRSAGTDAWHSIGKVPVFAPYLPRVEPFRAEDRAEALEPVEVGLTWKNPAEAEDEDVDMIPLIDISLVLLIFFMMTAAIGAGIFSPIQTPPAKHQLAAISTDMFWIGIDVKNNKNGAVDKGPDGKPYPWYSLGKENQATDGPDRDLAVIMNAFEKKLEPAAGEVRIRIRADRTIPVRIVKDVTMDLQGLEARLNASRKKQGRINLVIMGEVSEPSSR